MAPDDRGMGIRGEWILQVGGIICGLVHLGRLVPLGLKESWALVFVKDSTVLLTDKAASAEGARNERFSASTVCRITLVPSETVAPSSYQRYNTNIWSVARTSWA